MGKKLTKMWLRKHCYKWKITAANNVDYRLNLLKFCCALPPAQVEASHTERFDQLLTRTVINSWWWRWKKIQGEGSLDQTLLIKTFWRFMQSPKSQLQMRNMHHVVGNIEMDLSLEQLLASGKLFFNRACFNVPVHYVTVFWMSSYSPASQASLSSILLIIWSACWWFDINRFLDISPLLVFKNPANSSPCWSATHQNKCGSVSCNFLWTLSCLSFWSSREELIACTSSMQFSYLPLVEAAADPQNN